MSDGRVLMQRDDESGIARVTLANPERRNAYDPEMRRQLGAYLDELAYDDAIKVVILRGEGGVFSAGADMNNAYAWYGDAHRDRDQRPGRRDAERTRRALRRVGAARASGGGSWRIARRSTSTTSSSGYPKATVAEVSGFALGGGLRARAHGRHRRGGERHGDRDAGDPLPRPRARLAAPVLPPARPGARPAAPAHGRHDRGRRGGPPRRVHRGGRAGRGRGPRRVVGGEGLADAGRRDRHGQGGVPARGATAGRTRAKRCSATCSTRTAPTCSFEDGEFNFVKARAQHGTKKAFELRDDHFDVPEPEA